MSGQSFISTGYNTTSCTLALPSFQELNSNPRLFTISHIYFILQFRRYMSTQNISAIVCLCFEVSPGPFGYRVAHDSWQEIHHMSSKWNKMCHPQKKPSIVYWYIALKIKSPAIFMEWIKRFVGGFIIFQSVLLWRYYNDKKAYRILWRYYHSRCRPPRCHAGCHGAWRPHHERWAYTSNFVQYISGF